MNISKELALQDRYTIGKTVVSINRVFCQSDAKTLDKRILNLMKREREHPCRDSGGSLWYHKVS